MNLLESIHIFAWYKLRRYSRKTRNHLAKKKFADAVAALHPGSLCIDCGANVGAITRRLASTGATVHAFEPDPDAFAALVRNLETSDHVILHNAAVGVGNDKVKLYRGKPGPQSRDNVSEGSTLVISKRDVSSDAFVVVDQIDFASFVDGLGTKVAILKIDIEGAEITLLNDLLAKGLTNRFGDIFVETHEKQIHCLRKETMQLLKKCRAFPNIHMDWW
jgi:FkbM family methyltransferase